MLNRTPVRLVVSPHGQSTRPQSPSSIPRPAKGTDRKHESLIKGSTTRSRSRLSNVSTPSTPSSFTMSNPRSSSRLSFTHPHHTYASSASSSLSSSPFQSEVGEGKVVSRQKKCRIPRPVQSTNQLPKGYKIKGRRYYKYKQLDTLLMRLALYYRTKQVTAQSEESFQVVEHEIPATYRYMNSSLQLTPPPSRSREEGRSLLQKGIDIPQASDRTQLGGHAAHHPQIPLSPPHSLSNSAGRLSPSVYSDSASSYSESAPSDSDVAPVKREPSPIYCEEFSSSPTCTTGPTSRLYSLDPPHIPASIPNPAGTILLPIVEVSESQTGASSYPRRRGPGLYGVIPASVSTSEASGYISVPKMLTAQSQPELREPELQEEQQPVQPEPELQQESVISPVEQPVQPEPPVSESQTWTIVSASASEILHRDKKDKDAAPSDRSMSTVSIISRETTIYTIGAPSPSTIDIPLVVPPPTMPVLAKGEFSVAHASAKTTKACTTPSPSPGPVATASPSPASDELQKIDIAISKRARTKSVSSNATVATPTKGGIRGSRMWGAVSRWVGW